MNEGVSWEYATYAVGGLLSLLFGILLTFIGVFTGDLRGRIKSLELRDLEQAKTNTHIEIAISELNIQFTIFIERWKSEQITQVQRNAVLDKQFTELIASMHRIELRGERFRQGDSKDD